MLVHIIRFLIEPLKSLDIARDSIDTSVAYCRRVFTSISKSLTKLLQRALPHCSAMPWANPLRFYSYHLACACNRLFINTASNEALSPTTWQRAVANYIKTHHNTLDTLLQLQTFTRCGATTIICCIVVELVRATNLIPVTVIAENGRDSCFLKSTLSRFMMRETCESRISVDVTAMENKYHGHREGLVIFDHVRAWQYDAESQQIPQSPKRMNISFQKAPPRAGGYVPFFLSVCPEVTEENLVKPND